MEKSLFSPDGIYARVMNWIWDILVISVLWVLCCIPVITIGAASAAAYYTAAKVIRGGEGKAVTEFFRAFRMNFKQSVPFSLGYVLLTVVALLECYYIYFDSSYPLAVLYLFYGMVLVLVASAQYLFALLSRFTMPKFALLRMAVVCGFRHLLTTIILLLLLALTGIGVYLMPWGILVFPGLMFLGKTCLMERILFRYMDPPETEEDKQKWFYKINER